jgi:hypothetical protein
MRHETLLGAAMAVGLAAAHGDHSKGKVTPQVDPNADWMTKHMAEEHHIEIWDAGAFHALHDYNSDGQWQPDEILRTYGLMDESNKDLPLSRRDEIIDQILTLLDENDDGEVSAAELRAFMDAGKTLPDVGTGPGHHGDDEYEYEIHHWEKYHDENTKLEDLTHPEDIEHFRKHEQMEDAQEKLEAMERKPVIEDNIPLMFRRQG